MSAGSNRAISASIVMWCVVAIVLTIAPAKSADAPSKTPAESTAYIPPYDWAGFYFGGHLGYGRGHVASTVFDPGAMPSSNSFGSLFAGLQGGYNFVLPSRLFLGIEGDISFANFYSDDQITARSLGQNLITEQIDYIGRVRGRFGY